ncbi:hypothetical protein OH491_21990 [Termitidicoccus mucosus]|uniref:hypothetical protein n=2 Tax=Termitidicoccus mucosus TaxID=1184151 RepID=UPI003182E2EA
MKLRILPLAVGLLIGASGVLAWYGMESSNASSQSGIISSSEKGRVPAFISNGAYAAIEAAADTIVDVDEKALKQYPNLGRLLLLDELKQNKKLNISVPIVDEWGKFNSNFKELFDLTDDQVSEIEDNIRALRRQMTTEMIDRSRVTREPHKTSIEIPPNENGVGYYDKFMDMMQGHLGADRLPAFDHFSVKQFDSLFSGYGAEKLNVTFEYSGDKITDGKIIVTEERTTKVGPIKQTFPCPNVETACERYPGLEKYLKN